jgi:hypothetical protein
MRKLYLTSLILFAQLVFCQTKKYKTYKFITSVPENFSPMRKVDKVDIDEKTAVIITTTSTISPTTPITTSTTTSTTSPTTPTTPTSTSDTPPVKPDAIPSTVDEEKVVVPAEKTLITKKTKIITETRITVLGFSKDSSLVYFKFWHFPEIDPTKKKYKFFKKMATQYMAMANEYNYKTFAMSRNEFNDITKPLYRIYKGTSVGAYTVPIRMRGIGGTFDFESSLSLTANLVSGFGFPTSKESCFDISAGIGISSINLNSKNSVVTEDRTASALTISTGVLFKPAKYANIGFFFGWDNLSSNDKSVNWEYNGKLWIGLGLNITFNEISTNTPQTPTTK